MKPLEIKGMSIGEGTPKTIISVMDPDVEGALATIEEGKKVGVDLYEWRIDFNKDVRDFAKVAEGSKKLAAALPDNPLLFTFRSVSQGGQLTFTAEDYVALNKAVIEAEAIDIVDIESWIGDAAVLDLVAFARQHGVKTIISYHNFAGTPSQEWMVNLLTHFVDMGADIPKIAVMAETPADCLKLLGATEEVHRLHFDGPLLTMAMGRNGSLSRLSGELFGSAITFCALKDASAPGQVDVIQAKKMMEDFHQVLS
ncbi:MAG: type I 3-dehydroquinate dehydratase [Eggerthellaceae bacterium]|jgi:3-dehydroquinate dehydratase-1